MTGTFVCSRLEQQAVTKIAGLWWKFRLAALSSQYGERENVMVMGLASWYCMSTLIPDGDLTSASPRGIAHVSQAACAENRLLLYLSAAAW